MQLVETSNDTVASAKNLGDLYQGYVTTSGATSNDPLIDGDYVQSQLGCGAADGSPDAIYRFNLSQPVRLNPRYPRYLCHKCAPLASAPDGRLLNFANEGISGGYVAIYGDTGEPYDSHVCFVQGVTCWADEARFGGIVIEALAPEALRSLIDRIGRPAGPGADARNRERGTNA